MVTPQHLMRASTDKVIGGVCGGLARYFGLDPAIVRLAMIGLVFVGGLSILIYPVLWLVMPSDAVPQYTLRQGLHGVRHNAHAFRQQAHSFDEQATQQIRSLVSGPQFDPQTGQPINGTQASLNTPQRNKFLGAILMGVGVMLLASYLGSSQIALALVVLGGGWYLLRRTS